MLYVNPVGPAAELVGSDLIAPMNSANVGTVSKEAVRASRAAGKRSCRNAGYI